MKLKALSKFAVVIASVAAFSSAWACSAMGPTTHVGKIMSYDLEKSTFTILDAETVSAVTFNADNKILERIVNAKGMVKVDFTDDGVMLTATDVLTQ